MAGEAAGGRRKRAAPAKRGMRVPDARKRFIAVRCNEAEYAAITEAADRSALGVGGYLRALALGSPGPRAVRRPPIERRELTRLLGALGKIGSNLNQIARFTNATGSLPLRSELSAIREELVRMRELVMKAMGRDH